MAEPPDVYQFFEQLMNFGDTALSALGHRVLMYRMLSASDGRVMLAPVIVGMWFIRSSTLFTTFIGRITSWSSLSCTLLPPLTPFH